MADMERDLRDMMDRTADGMHHVPRPSRRLVRRARLRRARTAAIAGTAAFALVIGGFAGARSLSSDDAAVRPADKSSRTETAVTVVEGSGEVRSRGVLELCEFLFAECAHPMMPGDHHLLSVEVSATRVGTDISGSGFIEGGGLDDSFTVRCGRQVDVSSIAVGGTFDEGERAGKGMALVIKDLDPDRLAIWFEGVKRDHPGQGGCDSMLDGIEVRGWGELIFEPVGRSNFTLGDEE